jgi:serine/threonine protein kinase
VNRGDQLGGGRYTLLDELGRGGMGVVWLAEDTTIGRRVAIKELHLPAGTSPQDRQVFEERVLREARTAGRLNDPGIVTVYDVVQEQGATYIVMELVESPTLEDVVAQRGPLPAAFVAKVAEQLLSALETAHAAGIVHRDVKPANVMVAPNGRVKLADFGIAQSIEDPRLTTSGTLIGSPTYISPERLLGQDASPASDLWALGATLFFAVEGYGAYQRPTTPAVIQAIMNERAQVRIAQGPMAELITGLMDQNPQTRLNPMQARTLIDQARVPGSTGEQTVNSTLVAPAPQGKSRRGLLIAGAAVAVAALATAGILVFGGDKNQPVTPASNPATTTSKDKDAAESAEPKATDESSDTKTKATDEEDSDTPTKTSAEDETTTSSRTGTDCSADGTDETLPACPTVPS